MRAIVEEPWSFIIFGVKRERNWFRLDRVVMVVGVVEYDNYCTGLYLACFYVVGKLFSAWLPIWWGSLDCNCCRICETVWVYKCHCLNTGHFVSHNIAYQTHQLAALSPEKLSLEPQKYSPYCKRCDTTVCTDYYLQRLYRTFWKL